jgi:hypothetical protein
MPSDVGIGIANDNNGNLSRFPFEALRGFVRADVLDITDRVAALEGVSSANEHDINVIEDDKPIAMAIAQAVSKAVGDNNFMSAIECNETFHLRKGVDFTTGTHTPMIITPGDSDEARFDKPAQCAIACGKKGAESYKWLGGDDKTCECHLTPAFWLEVPHTKENLPADMHSGKVCEREECVIS